MAEENRTMWDDIGDVECDLLSLQALLRVIQDSAEFSTNRTARGENPEFVLEDVQVSLGMAAKRLGDIVTDLQEIARRSRHPESERPAELVR